MDINQIIAIGAALVPCVAYIVTTMSFARRNREDILKLDGRISSLERDMNTRMSSLERDVGTRISSLERDMNTRMSSLERDVAIIKTICEERSSKNLPVC